MGMTRAVWVGRARVWVGHGLPGLIARTASGAPLVNKSFFTDAFARQRPRTGSKRVDEKAIFNINGSSVYISKAWRERPRHCGRGLYHEVPRNPPPSGDGDLLRVLILSLKILL